MTPTPMILSEYEQLRLTKIARNNAYLESIGLGVGSNKFSGMNRRQTTRKRKKHGTTTIVDAPSSPTKRRFSTRLLNTKPSPSPPPPPTTVTPTATKVIIAGLQEDPKLESAKRWMVDHKFNVDNGYSTIVATRKESQPLSKKKKLKRSSSSSSSSSLEQIEGLREYEHDAFFALREWKRDRGKELGYINPCVICHNKTLVEMCRFLPTNETELLRVWGMSDRRLNQHGFLMLEALQPWRSILQTGHHQFNTHNENANDDDDDDDNVAGTMSSRDRYTQPSSDWFTKSHKSVTNRGRAFPTGPWDDRRAWCANRNNCQSCQRHGPDGKWAFASQMVLDTLQSNYGDADAADAAADDVHNARDAGWRWFARPTGTAHYHQWWPPQRICDDERIMSKELPLGTMKVLEMIRRRRRTGKGL